MSVFYYNGDLLINGINDSDPSSDTTWSSSKTENRISEVKREIIKQVTDTVGFNGLMSTNLLVNVSENPSSQLVSFINSYVNTSKGYDAEDGDTVIITKTGDNSIYGRVVYKNTSWVWDYIVGEDRAIDYNNLENKPEINSIALRKNEETPQDSLNLNIFNVLTQEEYSELVDIKPYTLYIIEEE